MFISYGIHRCWFKKTKPGQKTRVLEFSTIWVPIKLLHKFTKRVSFNEENLARVIISILNFHEIDLTSKKFKNKFQDKIILLKNKSNANDRYSINSVIVNNVYFREKIEILKSIAKIIGYEKMNEWLTQDSFISKNKLNLLRKSKYKDNENKDEEIFKDFLQMIDKVNSIRNAVSHNDKMFSSKRMMGDLVSDINHIIELTNSNIYKELFSELVDIYYMETKDLNFKQNFESIFKNLIKSNDKYKSINN